MSKFDPNSQIKKFKNVDEARDMMSFQWMQNFC